METSEVKGVGTGVEGEEEGSVGEVERVRDVEFFEFREMILDGVVGGAWVLTS